MDKGKAAIKSRMEKINGVRLPLAERLPLEQPFSISVTTANVCNLSCEYCAISEKGRKRNKAFLDKETFMLFVKRLEEAQWHLKQIVLVGLGEPLLNKHIVDFVRVLKEKKLADKIHIVSNGVLLTHEMTDQLLAAGLDVLRISLNGLDDDDYQKYTGTKISVCELKENLTYFHKAAGIKGKTKLYIKIMDYMTDTADRRQQFYEDYTPIGDIVNIEYLTEMSSSLDYSNVSESVMQKGLKGFEVTDALRCPLPFYHIYLNAEGTISGCCVAGPWSVPPALQFGDLKHMGLDEIWNGKEFRAFLLRMLEYGVAGAAEACKACKAYKSYIYPEDQIDDESSKIAQRLKEKQIAHTKG